MTQIWCNGEWLDSANYPGAAQDRGATFGLGLFETFLAIDGGPIFVDRHLARLRKSGERLGWDIDFPGFSEIGAELLTRNGLASGRARLRLVITGGSGPHNDVSAGNDRLIWLSAFPAPENPGDLAVCLSPWRRNEFSPLAGMKTACYAENIIALDHARRLGFDETIFLNTSGHLCESATANLFLLKNQILLTPSLDSGCLPGIAREVIIKLAGYCRVTVEERSIAAEELQTADEIFLTSSTRGPIDVTRVGEQTYPKGGITARLRQYWDVEILRR
jgi:branched-subunit amino acid aminotransferase/4-amino-4-deoxychorismate lyase